MKHARFRAPMMLLWVAVILLASACQPQQSAPAAGGTQGSAAASGAIKDVPRNRTLIVTPWSDATGPLKNPDNWNMYLSGNSNMRNMGDKTMYEQLFYTNLNTGELIPWQAEGFEYNKDYTV